MQLQLCSDTYCEQEEEETPLEASEGNHDDLVMNLVMFGFFAQTQFFNDMTDINLKEMLFKQRMDEIEADIVPFGWVDDGSEYSKQLTDEENTKPDWFVDFDRDDMNWG